jgi:hypothetical protein
MLQQAIARQPGPLFTISVVARRRPVIKTTGARTRKRLPFQARRGSKAFFFEKKKQKTFTYCGFSLSGKAQPKLVKVFWFFFSKKNRLSSREAPNRP